MEKIIAKGVKVFNQPIHLSQEEEESIDQAVKNFFERKIKR